MKYELERLGADNFERLIQSLIKGVAENSAIVFGDGPDGQREAVVNSGDFAVNGDVTAHGYTVVQAKFKSPDGKERDWPWLRKNLEHELEGFKRKSVTHPHIVPETYLFFTNIVITPTLDDGIRDKVEKFAARYKNIIPNISIFGADDIRAMLDNNRDVARCYASFITPGDILMEMHKYLQAIHDEKFEDLIEYAHQMFREDSAVRLEQAGSVANRSINIRNVYTDLEAKAQRGSGREIEQIAAYIIELGNHVHKRKYAAVDAFPENFQRHQRSAPECNIVLLGNAGQGKSTLCQYICQIYRAALLRHFEQTKSETENYLSEDSSPRCERFPILINLKRYAAWLNKQEEGKSRSVISYVLSLINGKANSSLSVYDFRRLLSDHSWVFLFDGLDEVPASSNRNETLKQIQEFLEKDLPESSCDSLVICTSRPQGYDYAFSTSKYNHYELKDMSKPLCKDYIDKLLRHMEENSDKREDYRKILHVALDDPMISKLMTTPLYTAIIVLLVKMGVIPPSKRYSLFEEYCNIIIKREKQKEMLPLLNKEDDWVETLHAQIGFLLQTESESAENAAAELSSTRCKEIITGYLRDEEFDGDMSKKTEEFYQAITSRLSFLSEVSSSEQETCVIFPLRSLQEYFAAKWLLSFDNEDKLSYALEIISVSAYWRNVYLFVAGFFVKNKHRKNMNEALFRICQLNNGDENHDSPNAAVHRIALQGSWLALDLLCDNLFSRPNDQHRYLNIAAKLLDGEHYTAYSTKRLLQLPSSVANIFLEEKVIPYLKETKKAESLAFEFLWGMASGGNRDACVCLEELIGDITPPDPGTIYRLLSYRFDNIRDKTLSTLFRWITEDYFGDFCLKSRFFRGYWNFLSYLFTHSQDMEPSLPAIRQAAYKILDRRFFKQKMENVPWPHPLIRKMLIDNRLNDLLAYSLPKASNLKYRPICRSFSKILLKEYAEAFHSYGLNELSALMEFLDFPSYDSLSNLFVAYRDLPENCKDSFIDLMEQYNWLLQEIADSLLSTEREEDVFSRYDNEYFEMCLAKDRELAALIEAEDIISITKSNYWNKISISVGMTIPPDMIRKLLDNTDKDNINNSFLSILCEAAMFRKKPMPELLQFGMDNFPFLFQTFYGVQLALTLFEKALLKQLICGNIDYPKTMRIAGCIYLSDGEERAGNLLKKIDKLVRADIFQAYALLPYFYNCVNREALLKLSPDTMAQHYDKVKATNNPAALLGCILRVLTGSVSDEQRGTIREDLLKLLPINSFAYTLSQTVGFFSMDGKLTVYEAVNALDKEMGQSVSPLGMMTHIILEELESSPVNHNGLMCLSKEAHSDRNFS